MFQIGFTEIIVIAVVILLFVRPRDLPAFMRKMGKLFGQIKGFTRAFNRQMREAEFALRMKEQQEKPEQPVTADKITADVAADKNSGSETTG